MPSRPQVLQICHSYGDPFLYLSSQYAALFKDTPYQITTVYLKGKPNEQVVQQSKADEVIFLNLKNNQTRGLKLYAIYFILKLHLKKKFVFCICQRHQPLYIATHIPGLRVIGVLHDFDEYNRLGRRLWALWHKKKLALLGVSNDLRDTLRQRLPRFPHTQIQTLHNSVNPQAMRSDLFTRHQAQTALGLSDHFWFVHVGRLVPDKDQATLIRGFAHIAREIPKARLAIIGQGELDASLKALAFSENITDKIVFLGNIPSCARYLLAFDSFILTSKRETFGMVLLEAMVAGLPIIASDLVSINEVVGETAWRFAAQDPIQLSTQIKTVYELSDNDRQHCQERMFQRVNEHYSTESMQKQFWSLPFVKNWQLENAQGRNRTGTGD